MSMIDIQNYDVASTLRDAAKSRADAFDSNRASKKDVNQDTASAQGRTVHDTVSLSENGQKIVNLDRAASLAETIKSAPIDKDFATTLKQATDDMFRIGKLFSQTIRGLFSWFSH